MKKLFIFAAAIATLASCSKNEVTSIASDASDTALSFENIYGRITTRGANSVDGDNAYVLGRQNVAGSYLDTWYLEDGLEDDVTTTLSSTSFLSGFTYYWPTDATTKLDFLAFAPCPWANIVFDEYGEVDTELSEALGNFLPIGDYTDEDGHLYKNNVAGEDAAEGYVKFTFLSVDGETELTAARTTTYNNEQNGAVPLNFIQLLAKLSVELCLDDEMTSQGYTIESGNVAITVGNRRGIFELDIDQPYDNYLEEKVCYLVSYPEDATSMSFPAKDAAPGSVTSTNVVPQASSGTLLTITDMVIYKDGKPAYEQATANTDNETGEPVAQDLVYKLATGDIDGDMFHEGIRYWMTLEIDLDDIFDNKITFNAGYSEFTSSHPGTFDYE